MQPGKTILGVFCEMSGSILACTGVAEAAKVNDDLSKESFQFLIDERGQEYVPMTQDKATANHPGGIEDTSSVEKEARILLSLL